MCPKWWRKETFRLYLRGARPTRGEIHTTLTGHLLERNERERHPGSRGCHRSCIGHPPTEWLGLRESCLVDILDMDVPSGFGSYALSLLSHSVAGFPTLLHLTGAVGSGKNARDRIQIWPSDLLLYALEPKRWAWFEENYKYELRFSKLNLIPGTDGAVMVSYLQIMLYGRCSRIGS